MTGVVIRDGIAIDAAGVVKPFEPDTIDITVVDEQVSDVPVGTEYGGSLGSGGVIAGNDIESDSVGLGLSPHLMMYFAATGKSPMPSPSILQHQLANLSDQLLTEDGRLVLGGSPRIICANCGREHQARTPRRPEIAANGRGRHKWEAMMFLGALPFILCVIWELIKAQDQAR